MPVARRGFTLGSVLLAGGAFGLLLVATPAQAALDRARYIEVDEIVPGMKGYGLSVFSGAVIDTFQVEVLGVRRNYFPKNDMILAYGRGHGLEHSGIVAGMSGSPVYFDGRLAGALAYGWDYQSSPIMGITPIASMLNLNEAAQVPADLAGVPGAASAQGRAAWEELLDTRGEAALGLAARRAARALGWSADPAAAGLTTRVPLWSSGLDPDALRQLTEWLAPTGLTPIGAGAEARASGAMGARAGLMAGGAGAAADGAPLAADALVPGAAIAIPIVQGDASLSAVGTVTWREGDRVLAFGHPMFHMGRTALPMATARIETVMPSFASSFKFGTASQVVGTLDVDMRNGIGGRIGASPRTIPMDLMISDPLSGPPQNYHYEIVDNPDLTPVFCASMAGSSALALGKRLGDATVDVATTITLVDGRALKTVNTMNVGAPSQAAASQVVRPLSLLMDNPLGVVAVASVRQEVTIRHHTEALTLQQVVLTTPEPRVGGVIEASLLLKNYRGALERRAIRLAVPEGLPAREYLLQIADADTWLTKDGARAPALYRPQTIDQLLTLLSDERSETVLQMTLVDPRPGVAAPGAELGRLPGSVMAALRSGVGEDGLSLTQGTNVARGSLTLPVPVNGFVELKVTLKESARDDGRGSR